MKNIYSLFISMMVFGIVFSQSPKDVSVKIYHKVDGNNLEVGSGVYTNWEGTEYTVTRVQFYMSSISLTHNGGEVLELTDQYVLTKADQNVYPLGERTIGTLEKITFDVGVDPDHNHLDPATYSFEHPLAHQSPEMHWGWAAGYRFLAIEGLFDDDGDNIPEKEYQFHVVGNEFLRTVELTTSGEEIDDQLIIHVEADYNKLFNNLVIADNWWVHGGGPTNELMMDNINDFNTFTVGSNTSSISELNSSVELSLYPNPAAGSFTVDFNSSAYLKDLTLNINSIDGQLIKTMGSLSSQKVVISNELVPGTYFVSIVHKGQLLSTQKIIITQ